VSRTRPGPKSRLVMVETVEPVAGCPECGVLAGRVHEQPQVRIKDLPVGSGQLRLVWRKRRYWCQETRCSRRSFTETSEQVPGGPGSPSGSGSGSPTPSAVQPGGVRRRR
jgi:transposase